MSDSAQQPGGRAIWRTFLLVFLGLIVLACLFWFVLNLASKKGVALYEQQQNFNFADFIPKPVPAESNFALVPVVASSYEGELDENGHLTHSRSGNVINRLEMEIYDESSQVKAPDSGNWQLGRATDLKAFQAYYRSLASETNAFPVADETQSPAADVLLALSKYDETIEELRQAAALPQSRFPLNYDCQPPAAIMQSHLSGLTRPSHVLELRAVAAMRSDHRKSSSLTVRPSWNACSPKTTLCRFWVTVKSAANRLDD